MSMSLETPPSRPFSGVLTIGSSANEDNHRSCSALHSKLDEFRRDSKHCDVIVRIGERTFKSHRVVLASASVLFDRMFSSTFKESSDETVDLPDVDVVAFEGILEFAYTGLDPQLSQGNVVDFLRASEYLEVPRIKNLCIDYILRNKDSIENILEIFAFACAVHDCTLMNALSKYMGEHFYKISQCEDFIHIPFDSLCLVLKEYVLLVDPLSKSGFSMFKDDDLLLDAFIRWVRFSLKVRSMYFEELIKMVNLQRISSDYAEFLSREYKMDLLDAIEQRRVNSSSLQKFLMNNLSWSDQLSEEECYALPLPYGTSLKKDSLSLYVYYSKHDELLTYRTNSKLNVCSINKYEPYWSSLSRLQDPWQVGHTMKIVAIENSSSYDLYQLISSITSLNDHDRTIVLKIYSTPTLDHGRELTPPPCKFRSFDMCGLETYSPIIYLYNSDVHNIVSYENDGIVSPSFNDEEIHRGIFYYVCEIDKWFPVPEMRLKLAGSCTTASNDLLYVIGGADGNGTLRGGYVQAYDHRTPEFLELSSTNFLYFNGVCCALNGKIYVSDAECVEVFDPTAGRWEILSRPRQMHSNVLEMKRMVSYENRLWIMYSKNFYLLNKHYTDIFDPYDSSWFSSSLFNDIFLDDNREEYLTSSICTSCCNEEDYCRFAVTPASTPYQNIEDVVVYKTQSLH